MKVYISGPITSCHESYKEMFDNAAYLLRKDGHIPLNPATLPKGLDQDSYMPICLSMIDAADAILMIGGWSESKGAMLERAYAEYQGKEIWYDNE